MLTFFLLCVNFHGDAFILENIFTQQPSYYSDLDETVPTVLQVNSGIYLYGKCKTLIVFVFHGVNLRHLKHKTNTLFRISSKCLSVSL